MKIRLYIYNVLVNRVPVIQKEYHKLRLEKTGNLGRIYAWIMLLWMNICWICRSRKLEEKMYYPDINKKVEKGKAESKLAARETPQQLVNRLISKDVISFDIFDTLIFRPVCAPTDLFFFIGEKLHYMDFERMRKEMEHKARNKAFEKTGSYEVTLEDIYDEIEMQTGIDKQIGMKAEIETELEFCFANPYMLEVYRLLQEAVKETEKKIICISDMYLPSNVLLQMLEKCGYHGLKKIYVSCEANASKADGTLYKKVAESIGKSNSFIHIGDNPESDGKQAKKNSWETIHYANVNIVGMPYRAEDMSLITGTLYRGIINSRLYNGLKSYSSDYELGYIYGGIFVVGYCQFIHNYVKVHNIDKILFLSRDGNILYKVYQMLYPQEDCAIEYVYWSRTVATKMMAKYDRYDFLRRFIDHKVNQNYTVKEIYQSMGLDDMFQMEQGEYLTDKNYSEVRKYLLFHWKEVESHYQKMLEAGKKYYSQVLSGCRKAIAVDVGWAGSGALALDLLVNKEWNLECDIVGMIAGTNTLNNTEPNASEQFLFSGKLVSYLYSQEHNRENWKWHNPSKNHNLLVELLLSAKEGSLKNIVLDNTVSKGYRFVFKEPDVAIKKVEKIQQGIKDFAKDYCKVMPKEYLEKHSISGSDAYAVLKILLQSDIATEMEMGI